MKRKCLFFCLSFLFVSSISAQVFFEDDFESYPLGDFTGNQGGWEVETEEEAAIQIMNLEDDLGQSIRMNTSEIENFSGLFVTQFYDWENRDTGNNILTVEFDFYTGRMLDGFGMVVIGTEDFDIIIELGWDPFDESIYMYGGELEEVLLDGVEEDTWHHITVTYEVDTGMISGRVDANSVYTIVGNPNKIPAVFDFTSIGESEIGMDNVLVSAQDMDILEVPNFETQMAKVSLYPNPTSGQISIESTNDIAKVMVYDLTGRFIKTFLNQEQISIYELNAGSYLIDILFTDGTQSIQRIIKK